jgi:Fic family protein
MSDELSVRLARIEQERARIAHEEEEIKAEARDELSRLTAQIDELVARKTRLEEFLDLNDDQPAKRGQIRDACLGILRGSQQGLTSREVASAAAAGGLRTASIPATLSRLVENGLARRDSEGRYYVV